MNVSNWINEVRKYASDDVEILLVGNKSDLSDLRAVSYEEAKEIADSLGVEYIETSAKSGSGVENSFVKLTENIKRKIAPSNNLTTSVSNVHRESLTEGVAGISLSGKSENEKRNCQYQNCDSKAEFLCECSLPSFGVCSNHCLDHINQDISKVHPISSVHRTI